MEIMTLILNGLITFALFGIGAELGSITKTLKQIKDKP